MAILHSQTLLLYLVPKVASFEEGVNELAKILKWIIYQWQKSNLLGELLFKVLMVQIKYIMPNLFILKLK